MAPNLSSTTVYNQGYRLVYPCQGHSDVHLHGNTARRRRRVTARVSIRPPDKRLLGSWRPPLSRGSLTRDVMAPPWSTRRNKVLACTSRLGDATVAGRRASSGGIPHVLASPAQRHVRSYRETRNIHRARFTSCSHKRILTAPKTLYAEARAMRSDLFFHGISKNVCKLEN